MKITYALACLALLAVAACQPAGYYDNHGKYHAYGREDTFRTDSRGNVPGGLTQPTNRNASNGYYDGAGYWHSYGYNDTYPITTTTTTYSFDRPGFYNDRGTYVTYENAPRISRTYYPSRGMCRIWYPDRDYSYQGPIVPCDTIQGTVPAGAYVVYGG